MSSGSELILTLMLSLMMFAVALGLRPSSFAFFKHQPLPYLAGVIAQLVGLPLLTLILVIILKPLPSIALGMILVACCPGGTISNILALFGKANTALSVSLTATSSLAAAFITPISIVFWSSLYGPTNNLLTTINFDILEFLMQTLVILALPIIVGMAIATKFPAFAARLQKPLAMLAAISLMVLILATFYKHGELFTDYAGLLIPIVVIHNGLAFALGYVAGLVSKADRKSRRALVFEVGIQNSGLGFVILITQMSGLGGAAAITGMWGLWHIIAGGVMVGIFRFSEARHERANV